MLYTLAHQDPGWIVLGVVLGVALGAAMIWALLGRRHDR